MPIASHITTNAPTAIQAFQSGLLLSLSLIIALGPQNTHVLRMGLTRQYLALTIAVCVVSDVLLIAIGVFGLAHLGGLSIWIKTGLMAAGMLFLLVYGTQAALRFFKPPLLGDLNAMPAGLTTSCGQAVGAALAFAWLNPHAWLDTAVLIGSASLAWGQPGNAWFGLGAALGSALWFVSLGLAVLWLGQRLRGGSVWRVLDALVAMLMWGTALILGRGLLASSFLQGFSTQIV